MHTQAYNHTSDNDSNCLHAQLDLPPQQKAFTFTTNGICKHNQRHLPTHSKAFAPTTKDICLLNTRHLPPQFTHSKAKDNCFHAQRHLLPQRKVFASTTNGICPHNQSHLPTLSRTFAPTTKGICLHNARHLPPTFMPLKVFAPTTKLTCLHNARTFCVEKLHTQQKRQPRDKTPNGICQHYQRHLPTHSMTFAPTTKLTHFQESLVRLQRNLKK